jgi:hypothetical protein
MRTSTDPSPLTDGSTTAGVRAPRTDAEAARPRRWRAWALVGIVAAAVVGGARPEPPRRVDLAVDVVLADSDLAIADLVRVVEVAAEAAGVERPIDELTVILTEELPGADQRPLWGGLQSGATVWVRIDGLAMPSRTLLHEVAHALTPGDGHGERFREVYLAAMTEVYGAATASREARRLAWVYDRCYLDATCPIASRAPRRSPRGHPPPVRAPRRGRPRSRTTDPLG